MWWFIRRLVKAHAIMRARSMPSCQLRNRNTNLVPGTCSSSARRSANWCAQRTQSSTLTPLIGTNGHTSSAPSRACSPARASTSDCSYSILAIGLRVFTLYSYKRVQRRTGAFVGAHVDEFGGHSGRVQGALHHRSRRAHKRVHLQNILNY